MANIVFYITLIVIAAFIILSKTFSAFWLLILALIMLWPQRNEKNARPVFLFTTLLVLLFILLHYFRVLAPFIVGIGLAYILTPPIDFLERKKMPRSVSILICLLPVVAVFPAVFFIILWGLLSELQGLVVKIPEAFHQIQLFSGAIISRLSEVGIAVDPNVIAETITSHLTNIISGFFKTIEQIGRGVGGILLFVYNIVLIPLSAYLFLSDRERITNWFRNLFEGRERTKVDEFIRRLNLSLAQFFRGQIILIVVVGFIVGFALWLSGIKYFLLLGLIAGLCNIIPNVGYVLSFIPAIFIGLLSPTPWLNILKIIGVYVVEQLLENFYLGPAIIGRSSRLHPAVVMIILILGGLSFGFWGVLLAVPVAIFVREFLHCFIDIRL